jgi:hypothetical protein
MHDDKSTVATYKLCDITADCEHVKHDNIDTCIKYYIMMSWDCHRSDLQSFPYSFVYNNAFATSEDYGTPYATILVY